MENSFSIQPLKVLVRCKDRSNIMCVDEIGSSIFITDPSGWVVIDEGEGDTYAHAQGHYLIDKGMAPLLDATGRCNYTLMNNDLAFLTDEEKERAYRL